MPPDYATPDPAAKPPKKWWLMESMWGGITTVLAPAIFALLAYYGVLDTEGAALWGGLVTAAGGMFVLYGRINGFEQPSAVARKLLALPLAALLLAGCAGTADYRQALAESCLSYARALASLADARAAGTLDGDAVRQVRAVRIVVDPICTDQSGVAADAATLERLRGPINTLITLAAGG